MLRRDPDDEGKRWRGEGYDRWDGVNEGCFGVDDEIVVMRGKGKAGEVNKIGNRRRRLIIARVRKVGEDGD